MKKIIIAVSLLTSLPVLAANRALVVSIFGNGQEMDFEAYKEVLKLTGGLIEENQLEKYIVNGFGREGGSEFCIQLNSFQRESTLQEIQNQYQLIVPNKNTTSYFVKQAATCPGKNSKK
jgi:hypothetical protein